jgi:hypothetical protein
VFAKTAWKDIPQPPRSGRVGQSGPRTLGLLAIGTGHLVGLGAVDHDVALAGHLARSLAALLDRGIDLAVEVDVDLSPGSAAALLTAERLRGVEAVILMLGMREALRQSSLSRWRSDLTRLFAQIASADDGRVVILAVDVASVPSMRMLRTLPRSMADRYAAHLNAVLHEVVAGCPNARSIPFDAAASAAIRGARSDAVRGWARGLATPLAAELRRIGSAES